MLCPKCNAQNRDNAKFCKVCGFSFVPSSTNADQAPTAQESQVAPVEQQAVQAPAQPLQPAPQAEAAVEKPQEAAPVSPPALEARGVNATEDPSLAPTQILTPQQMVAIQARRWQQEIEREQSRKDAGDIADMPTIRMPLPDNEATVYSSAAADAPTVYAPTSSDAPTVYASGPGQGAEQNAPPAVPDVADMPTVLIQPQGAAPTPPPPPAEALSPENSVAAADSTPTEQAAEEPALLESNVPQHTAEVVAAADDEQVQATEQGGQVSEVQEPTEANSNTLPTLSVGTLLAGRYEVTEITSTDDNRQHVYQVVDRQGYQKCWNCGSDQNAEGDEFCINCGAELLNAPYILHEYPGSQRSEERVITGSIVNTFIEQGHTYIIEQAQVAQESFPNGVRLLGAGDSDAGDTRRSEPNEDSTLVLELQRVHESTSTPVGLYVVADGLGGHENGQLASRTTIGIVSERIVRELLAAPLAAEKNGEQPAVQDEDEIVTLLKGAVEDANTVLCQINQRDKTDMGSTITGFMLIGDHAYILNVGDSRTYMVRDNNIYQLTTDHSLVGQLVASGMIEPDDVYTHPQRSQIFRSLGDKLNVQIDIFKQQVHPGDILLSCSDGLWEMIRNPQIKDILTTAPDPQSACSTLIDTANTNGGEDNVSAVVVYVR